MPGGMLRYGIPEYRLPKAVLDAEIDAIRRLGAEIRCGVRVGAEHGIRLLLAGGYDAVLVAAGAQRSRPMGIPGEALPGVLGGVDLLAAVAGGASPALGDEVVVVGGGDTAIDAARTARRLGARRVTIAYRRSREEMPATPGEIAAAEEEGSSSGSSPSPSPSGRRAGGLEIDCRRMALGPPDESGRRRPVPVEGGVHTLAADRVVMAIGQSVDASVLDGSEIAPAASGLVPADAGTFETGLPGVFAAEDCVTGPDIAIAAVAAGRRAAFAIDAWLRTGAAAALPRCAAPRGGTTRRSIQATTPSEPRVGRMGVCRPGARERTADFREVEATAPEEDAVREAYRCLSCGCERADDCTLRDLARDYGVEQNRFGSPKRWQIRRPPPVDRARSRQVHQVRALHPRLHRGAGDRRVGVRREGAGDAGRPAVRRPAPGYGLRDLRAVPDRLPDRRARGAARRRPRLRRRRRRRRRRAGGAATAAARGGAHRGEPDRLGPARGRRKPLREGAVRLRRALSGRGILSPFLGRGASSRPAAWREAAEAARAGLGGVEPRRIAVFVSPRITNEEAFEAQRLARRGPEHEQPLPRRGGDLHAAAVPRTRARRLAVGPRRDREERRHRRGGLPRRLEPRRRLSVVAARRRAARIIVVGREQTKLDRIAAENVRVPPDRFAAYGARLASLFRGAKRPAIVFTRDALPAATLRALHRLAARTGAGIVSLCAEANGQGLLDAGVSPFVLPGQRPIAAPARGASSKGSRASAFRRGPEWAARRCWRRCGGGGSARRSSSGGRSRRRPGTRQGPPRRPVRADAGARAFPAHPPRAPASPPRPPGRRAAGRSPAATGRRCPSAPFSPRSAATPTPRSGASSSLTPPRPADPSPDIVGASEAESAGRRRGGCRRWPRRPGFTAPCGIKPRCPPPTIAVTSPWQGPPPWRAETGSGGLRARPPLPPARTVGRRPAARSGRRGGRAARVSL